MAYEEKTDWLPDDPINEDDVNRWEKGIKDAHTDLAAHKNDMNNPHNTTKAQVGLGNVDNVQQAAKKDFDQHVNDDTIHITAAERSKWNNAQLSKISDDDGRVFYKSVTEITDYNNLTDTGMYLIYNDGLNGPGLNRCFLLVMSYKNTLVQIAYDGFKGEQSFFRIRKNDSATWTAWIESETTEGSQKKIDAHANKTDIHVTKSDKDKWNHAQLYKLTDTQGHRTKIPDGTDLLTLPSGFYYAVGSVITNNPVLGDGSWYNYDVIETGGGGRKTILASRSYDGTFWMATIHTDGVFKGWNKIETEASAQNKADKSLAEAKNYVDTNYTNQKLIILTGSNAIQDARTGGDEYPRGLTLMDVGQGNTTGYPLGYGIIKNEKYHDYRFAQYFYGTGNESNSYFDNTGTWVRHWWSGSGWTAWHKISGFAHANIGTTGIQYLDKAAHTKIQFNRKIKDSHNAFDTKNSRFVAPNDGMFLVGVGLYMINTPAYINFHLKLYLNGSLYKPVDHKRGDFVDKQNEMYLGLNGYVTVPMNKGDYIEIYCYCNYGGSDRRGVSDYNEAYNFINIQEIGGLNYPTV